MRIHTDTLTRTDFIDALREEKAAGRIAAAVTFEKLEEHGSRTHARAFEIQLAAFEKLEGEGRRYGNSGGYGATSMTTGDYAATYDEWGWLLAALFIADEAREGEHGMRAGSEKYPAYRDFEDFDHQTGYSYHPTALIAILERDGIDPYPARAGREGRYSRGYALGRYGYGRIDAHTADDRENRGYGAYITNHPRTVADVRRFSHLEEVHA